MSQQPRNRHRHVELGSVDALVEDAAALGVALSQAQAGSVLLFGELLLHWNARFNLISRQDEQRLRARHLLDSLSIAPYVTGAAALDIGSGAGLPGIPLAIALPEIRFVLVDRNERKARFLQQAVLQLSLDNVEVFCGDVSGLAQTRSRRFGTVTARAVAEIPAVWRLARPLLEDGGRAVLMSRVVTAEPTSSEPEAPGPALEFQGGEVSVVASIAVPGLADLHEVVIIQAVDDRRNTQSAGTTR